MDIIDIGIKYNHNGYNRDRIDIIDIGIKYRHHRYNRQRYKILTKQI